MEFVLAMPAEHGTPFRFVGLDWNPVGHPPAGIYDAPNFDIHFYTITGGQRELIDRTHPDFAVIGIAGVGHGLGPGGVPAPLGGLV